MHDIAPTPGRFEMLVGLRVIHEDQYQRYRDAITPMLEQVGGYFRYDMRVEEMLAGHEGLSRVFVMSFPNRATGDAFFEDAAYKEARAMYFDPAVETAVVIAEYDLG